MVSGKSVKGERGFGSSFPVTHHERKSMVERRVGDADNPPSPFANQASTRNLAYPTPASVPSASSAFMKGGNAVARTSAARTAVYSLSPDRRSVGVGSVNIHRVKEKTAIAVTSCRAWLFPGGRVVAQPAGNQDAAYGETEQRHVLFGRDQRLPGVRDRSSRWRGRSIQNMFRARAASEKPNCLRPPVSCRPILKVEFV